MKLIFFNLNDFEWDDGNLRHIKKHNVTDQECEEVFLYSKTIVLRDNKHSILEERFKIFGTSLTGRKLMLVFTIRENKIRVIMVRDQNKKERGDLNE